MKVWHFILATFLILTGIAAYLVFRGIPIMLALAIYIYPICIFIAHFIYAIRFESNTKTDEKNDTFSKNYPDAVNGDVYLNPYFGDLWIVDGHSFIKINNGCSTDIDESDGFVKVGHLDSVYNKVISK